jgi:outer membrane protein assembly factor BamB
LVHENSGSLRAILDFLVTMNIDAHLIEGIGMMPRFVSRESFVKNWFRITAAVLLMEASAGAGSFSPPDDNAEVAPQIQSLSAELKAGNAAAAAEHAESLLANHASDLVATADPGLIESVQTRISTLADGDTEAEKARAAMSVEYAKKYESAASAMLQSVRLSALDPVEYYAVARRYPMTPTAGGSLLLAGDRAAELGDLPTAADYYRMALAAGATPDLAERRRIEALGGAGYSISNSTVADAKPNKDSSLNPGIIPFATSWYGNPSDSNSHRYFPIACGGDVYLLDQRKILAFTAKGGLEWAWTAQASFGTALAQQGQGTGVKSISSPISLMPVIAQGADSPRIVVAPVQNVDTWGLVALRAQDQGNGTALWTTGEQKTLSHLWFSPSAFVSGKYVYAVAVDPDSEPNDVLVLGLDLTSGREIWRTTVGAIARDIDFPSRGGGGFMVGPRGFFPGGGRRGGGGFGRRGPGRAGTVSEDLAYPTPAGFAVEGDQLVVVPNYGCAIVLGKYDGKIRWIHQYEQDDPSFGNTNPRYDNRPVIFDGVVVVAGQDESNVQGYDLNSGRFLWKNEKLDKYTLAGADGGTAIFAGPDIYGLGTAGGDLKWIWTPNDPAAISGPPIVHSGTIYVPTTKGLKTVGADKGKEVASAKPIILMQNLLASQDVLDSLLRDDALDQFQPTVGGNR